MRSGANAVRFKLSSVNYFDERDTDDHLPYLRLALVNRVSRQRLSLDRPAMHGGTAEAGIQELPLCPHLVERY